MIISQEEIKSHIVQAAKELHAQSAWLFGSYARGEAREDSDVDVLFVVDGADKARMQYILNARRALRAWKVAKDVVVYDTGEFEDWQKVKGALCHRVKQEGVLCYEA